jgi:hypothetical protein
MEARGKAGFHRHLSVADDELARTVSLQLRSRLIDGSTGEFRLSVCENARQLELDRIFFQRNRNSGV